MSLPWASILHQTTFEKKEKKKAVFFADPYHGVKQVKLFRKPLGPHGGSTTHYLEETVNKV